ncbi:MAG TPA: chromate efflux transporter, partial [Steroidobacteraceae bacterium]|nr:chromate efflux transporter [Steroidobacteraceae bacterium]
MSTANERKGSATEVGAAFLKLGLTSFGGPIAHLGYFRREFVERRGWIDEERFGQLLGLCQFLPGPASSQLGFSLGLLRAGWRGALAAFVGFTLPSALLMFAFAVSNEFLSGALGGSAVHGLKLVAVAVVAQGVLGMARTLTPDPPRAMMAAVSAGLVVVSGSAWMQLVVVAGGALLGPWLCRPGSASAKSGSGTLGSATSDSPIAASVTPGASFTLPYGRRLGSVLLLSFGILLTLALVVAPTTSPTGQVAGAFFRAGALVFGGGHVVLPLLEHSVVDPGWIDNGTFLAGYGAAQALPGPMFTFAAFLGERLHYGPGGISGATVGLLAIFLPGFLIVAGVLPYWQTLSARDTSARSLAGVNAAVVGLLA